MDFEVPRQRSKVNSKEPTHNKATLRLFLKKHIQNNPKEELNTFTLRGSVYWSLNMI